MLRRSVYNQERETSICKQNVICYNLATLGYQSICFFLFNDCDNYGNN